eukprot:scaffold18808_cov67-Phaeocystis_antarctica.AAC.1
MPQLGPASLGFEPCVAYGSPSRSCCCSQWCWASMAGDLDVRGAPARCLHGVCRVRAWCSGGAGLHSWCAVVGPPLASSLRRPSPCGTDASCRLLTGAWVRVGVQVGVGGW